MSTPHPPAGTSAPPTHRYTAELADRIELKWQAFWAEHGTFAQPNPGEDGFDASKPKCFILDMFPYPSGSGLHVGHPEGYTATDIYSRAKRMQGHNVLHTMGWDAFGLPAEQYAIQTGVHPAITTKGAIDNFRVQLQRFGFDYDWSREVATIDPEYYRWTQWIWLQAYTSWFDPQAPAREGEAAGAMGRARPIDELEEMLERGDAAIGPGGDLVRINSIESDTASIMGSRIGATHWHELDKQERREFIDRQRLAYLGEQTVNWCPKLGTALANEEVIDGRSERGGHAVLRMPLRQWMFRITDYAQRLLVGLDTVDWPNSTKTQQREWIGRSEGAEIDFELEIPDDMIGATSGDGAPGALRVFTTRPDTLFGATYMVVAPEHPLVDAVLASPMPETDASALGAYAEASRNRADVERQEAKVKTGVFTGVYAINPINGARIPVWTADYVLMGYGTGAIMAVPSGDDRDFEFAKAFGLPIVDVVLPPQLAAVAYYAHRMTEEEAASGSWLEIASDIAGYVTSYQVQPSEFEAALAKVRVPRRSGLTPEHRKEYTGDSVVDGIGASGLRRGSTQLTWREFFEDLRIESPEALREVFAEGGYTKRVDAAFTGGGVAVNSSSEAMSIDGMSKERAVAAVTAWLEDRGVGGARINYKLRDWLFSRQRYWGEPFPIVYDEDGNHHPVGDAALPVELPALADYEPVESNVPAPLLAKATDWLKTTAGEAGVDPDVLDPSTPVTRETNTMPGWAGSCWYYLRYADPHNDERPIGEAAERYWMNREHGGIDGVDLYVGGSEHAVLHLLYARFWHKILFDLGHVATAEPFGRLYHQGLILSYGYMDREKRLIPVDEVMLKGDPDRDLTVADASLDDDGHVFVRRDTGEQVSRIICKMSKSLKNVVNPDDIIREFGADAFRLYEMYIGPLDASQPWRTTDMVGLMRFLQRVWRLAIDEETGESVVLSDADADEGLEKLLHRTIAKVGEDIERLAMNTAIATMIEFVNAASKAKGVSRGQMERFVRILSPFAPHIAEEIWSRLGMAPPCSLASWPAFDASKLVDDEVEVPVQIMGKIKARIMVSPNMSAADLEAAALAEPEIAKLIEGKTIRKVVAVPGKLVNIVAN